MSIARRDWVAGRQGGEAHRPVLPDREAAAPRTLRGGQSKEFKTVSAHGAAAREFCKMLHLQPKFFNNFNVLEGSPDYG
jgi:hypothetical protein